MKKAIFFNGTHDYDLEIIDNQYILYYSNDEQYHKHIRNTVALSIVNTGNGFKFTNQKKRNWLGYDEALHMYIILAAEKDYKIEMFSKEKDL